jgi:hypothetical protein
MQKITKIAGIVTGLILILYLGTCFYMVACISCKPPAIETYKFSGSMDELENGLKTYAKSNLNTYCKVSYRGGTTDFSARDVTITKITGIDSLKYQLVIYDFNGSTRLDLTCLYSTARKLGGCSKKDKGFDELFSDFRIQFLPTIKREQGLSLKTTIF